MRLRAGPRPASGRAGPLCADRWRAGGLRYRRGVIRSRTALRTAVLAAPLLLATALPAAASAAVTNDLPGHTGKFSVTDGILIFGVAPVGVFLLIALAVMRPGTSPKGQRYRPGRDWNAEPSWSGLRPAAPPGAAGTQALAIPAGVEPMPVMGGAADHHHTDSTTEAGGSGSVDGQTVSPPRGGEVDPTLGGGARGSW